MMYCLGECWPDELPMTALGMEEPGGPGFLVEEEPETDEERLDGEEAEGEADEDDEVSP